MNKPNENPNSMSEQILALLNKPGNEKSDTIEALRLFDESDELVDKLVIEKLDSAMSAWGLRPQVTEDEIARRVEFQKSVPRPAYPNISSIEDNYFSATRACVNEEEKVSKLPTGIESLPAKIHILRLATKYLVQAAGTIKQLKACIPQLEAYINARNLSSDILSYGGKFAMRIKPPVLVHSQEISMCRLQNSIADYENLLNSMDSSVSAYIEELSMFHADAIALKLNYKAQKAELVKSEIQALIDQTVAEIGIKKLCDEN